MFSRIPEAIANIRDMFSNSTSSKLPSQSPMKARSIGDIDKLSLEELGLSQDSMRYDDITEILPQVKLNAFYMHYNIDPKSPTLYETLLNLVCVRNWDYSKGKPSLCDIELDILTYRVE